MKPEVAAAIEEKQQALGAVGTALTLGPDPAHAPGREPGAFSGGGGTSGGAGTSGTF